MYEGQRQTVRPLAKHILGTWHNLAERKTNRKKHNLSQFRAVVMLEPSLWAESIRIRTVGFRVIVQDPCVGTNLGLRELFSCQYIFMDDATYSSGKITSCEMCSSFRNSSSQDSSNGRMHSQGLLDHSLEIRHVLRLFESYWI